MTPAAFPTKWITISGAQGVPFAEPVKVTPILTLPGWFVTSRVNDGIKVVNPKQIRQVVLNVRDAALPPQLIERVAYQLDQKCRDVEL